MKRGPTNNAINSTPKKRNITKSLADLLQEVSRGEYEDFRAYLKQKRLEVLDLSLGQAANINLSHLGKALQGTSVTTLDLWRNDIGDNENLDKWLGKELEVESHG